MQPFDALTMRAILQEARPILLNRKVEKIYQLGRDEVVIALRSKAGTAHLLVSAQASFGRLCLALNPALPKSQNMPPFCQLLRKHLGSGTLTALEQLPGERVADLTFSCVDELGNRSTKVLTAEIMGRHSNLVLWDKDSEMILGASHNVTQDMSRQREIASGLRYIRPPKQEKPSIFDISRDDFVAAANRFKEKRQSPQEDTPATAQQWLLATFAGLGRHLAEEVVDAAGIASSLDGISIDEPWINSLWERVAQMQSTSNYKPSMRTDLSRLSVLSWWRERNPESESEWKVLPSVNDLVDAYFRGIQLRTEIQQLRERIKAELKSEEDKLKGRLEAADKLLATAQAPEQFKLFGDLILANLGNIGPGQTVFTCANLFDDNGGSEISIDVNPNLTASQNAQHYYRLYAKGRTRSKAAEASRVDASARLAQVHEIGSALEKAQTLADLQVFKEKVIDRGRKAEPAPQRSATAPVKERSGHPRLMSFKSSDGFTIIVGRNKNENDVLVGKLTQPHDIWLHAQGLEGAHVLIKLPNKKDPPGTTLKEAAQVAARFAKTGLGGKVRVIYTYGKYVKKIGKDKPGLVRYENEKTMEVDTAAPMPPSLRKLFS